MKVVIVTGAGEKAFAAGADISQMVHQSGKEGRELAQLTHRANFLLENMRQVTIAAVNGFALGGGCELALACDIRIAAENILKTRKKLNEILAANTGQPIEVIERDTERDNYMTAEEAKAYGLIDAILTKH